MSGQLGVLLRVKTLKEEQAFRRLIAKRRELADAEEEVERASRRVADSAATLAERSDAIYRAIIGRDVEASEIDLAKGRVLRIEQDHARLVDDCERAMHVRRRIEEELSEAIQQHRSATRVKDKYVILHEDAAREILERVTTREEGEIEDIFGTRRIKLA